MIIQCEECGITLAIESENNYKCWYCDLNKMEETNGSSS